MNGSIVDEFKKTAAMFGFMLAMLVAGIILGCVIGYGSGKRNADQQFMTTDTIRKTDTCWIPSPPDTVTKTVTKTVRVPLHDTVILVDSVWVDLPFERHHSSLEDVADIWFSGYEARIDSAKIYRHQETVIQQVPVERPARDNIVGLEGGARDACVFYLRRFGSFHIGFSAGSTYSGEPTARAIAGFQF